MDRYLDDLGKRYGGIDSVLVWHTYPNIGIDNRNQYDLLRDMPGGTAGLKQMVADFHRWGVRVLFPVMLWDQGTRDARAPNWVATAEAMAEIGADGINGDTLAGVPRAFRAASDKIGHPLALEPEGGPADEALAWNNLTWGYDISGVQHDVETFPGGCGDGTGTDQTVSYFSNQTLRVYLRDNTCGDTYYEDGLHALVIGVNPQRIEITDSGGFCESDPSMPRPPVPEGNFNVTRTFQ